jgi:excisionase family DNA binding protein
VAKRFGVTPMTVYALARSGALRAVVFKTQGIRWTYRFRDEDIEDFIQGHLREGKATG